jgi:hypothetical protein
LASCATDQTREGVTESDRGSLVRRRPATRLIQHVSRIEAVLAQHLVIVGDPATDDYRADVEGKDGARHPEITDANVVDLLKRVPEFIRKSAHPAEIASMPGADG